VRGTIEPYITCDVANHVNTGVKPIIAGNLTGELRWKNIGNTGKIHEGTASMNK